MPRTFFARNALMILVVVAFLLPFALRGARASLQQMKNDVKDWLPAEFTETKEIEWFWQYFMGERFILVSWDGCTADDPTYRLFIEKLKTETPPSQLAAATPLSSDEAVNESAPDPAINTAASVSQAPADSTVAKRGAAGEVLARPFDFVGDRLGLFSSGEYYENWGGRQEMWLLGNESRWYFITPEGDLYAWGGSDAPLANWAGRIWRYVTGGVVQGEQVASLGPLDGPWYYAKPQRLNAQLFKTVTTGPDLLAELTKEGGVLEDNAEEAHRRLDGLLFGPDGNQTCLVLTLTETGLNDFHRSLGRGMLGKPRGRLFDVAEQCGISREQLRLGGPPVDNVSIDEEGTITLLRLVSMSTILGIVLAYICFRSITATVIVFFVGGISAVVSVAMVSWWGANVDAIMMSMPALVYVLGISGAVHLINYYRDALDECGLPGAPELAIAHGWKPAVLCSITTALGLASLYTSEIAPIRKFGLFSALAVMATLILLFTYLPAALQLWPLMPRAVKAMRRSEEAWYERQLEHFWHWFGGGIIRRHYLVSSLCVLVIAVVGFGVTRIDTSVNLLKLFDEDAKILHDYAWLEEHIGKLVPMEVVVKFAPETLLPPSEQRKAEGDAPPDPEQQFQLPFLERMELVDRVQKVVDKEFGKQGQNVSGGSLSAATFSPILPPPKGDTLSFARRGATNSRLEAHRDEFLRSDYLRIDEQDQSELWRVSVRIGALQDVDYGQFVSQIKCAVEPVLAAQKEREKILRAIAQQRSNGSFAAARVCLLGVPFTRTSEPDAEQTTAVSSPVTSPTESPDTATSHQVDQTQIFAESLRDLLYASRLRLDWHNPAETPMPEDLAAALASYDCVVLVSDHAAYDLQVIRKHAPLTIDARHHIFDPSTAVVTTANIPGGQSSSANLSAVYTGLVPIVYKAQRTLLNSLVESTFWSFITITPLMMFLARSIKAGLVAMLPNVLPVFVIFGSMGWMGIQVDIGSMMTASIALGVAVDDTIHYLSWFGEELGKTPDRKLAILAAYKRCATPTLQAAVISGLGLSIFAFSTFTPTQRFGYLMLAILFAGVVAELVFFPALLAGPLGRVFKPSKTARPTHTSNEAPLPALDSALNVAPPSLETPLTGPHVTPLSVPGTGAALRHDHSHLRKRSVE